MPVCEVCQRDFKSGNSLRVHRSRFHRVEVAAAAPKNPTTSSVIEKAADSHQAPRGTATMPIGNVLNTVEEHSNKIKEQADVITQVSKQVSELDQKLIIRQQEDQSDRKKDEEFRDSLLVEFRAAQAEAKLAKNPETFKGTAYTEILPPLLAPPDPKKVINDLARNSGVDFLKSNSMLPRPSEVLGLFRPSTVSRTLREQIGLDKE